MSLAADLLILVAAAIGSAAVVLIWRRLRRRRSQALAGLSAGGQPLSASFSQPALAPLTQGAPGISGKQGSQPAHPENPAAEAGDSTWRQGLRPEAALLMGGAFLTLFGQILFHKVPVEARRNASVILAIGLTAVLAGGLLAEGRLARWARLRRLGAVLDWLRVAPGQAVFLLLAPVFAFVAAMAAGIGGKMIDPVVGLLAWALGIFLVIAAGWPTQPLRWSPSWKVMGPALGLFVAALIIRGVQTATIPIVLSGDEGSAGWNAYEWLRGNTNNPFVVGWYSFPSLYFMLLSFSIRFLGTTSEAIRLTSALAGALTVVALYFVARPWLGNRAALMASGFLAAFHLHVNFSRIGLNNIWDGLGYVIVLGAFSHGWRTGRRASFILGGLVLGLTQYFYASSRMLVFLVVGWLLIASLLDRRRLRIVLPDLFLAGVAAIVPILPLIVFYIRFPNEFLAPLSRFSVLGEWMRNEIMLSGDSSVTIVLRQLGLGLKAFTLEPLHSWYTPETAILRDIPAAFFLLGIVLMLLHLRDERVWMVVLWILAFAVVGALSESTPAAQRYIAVAPALCLGLAYGVDRTAQYFARFWPRASRAIAVVSLVVVAALAADDLRFYFLEYTPKSQFGGDNGLIAQRLADRVRRMPATTHIGFFGSGRMGFFSIPSLQYLAPHIQGTDLNNSWESPENPPVTGDPLLYVFLPEREDDLKAALADMPGGELVEERSPLGHTLFWLYEAP